MNLYPHNVYRLQCAVLCIVLITIMSTLSVTIATVYIWDNPSNYCEKYLLWLNDKKRSIDSWLIAIVVLCYYVNCDDWNTFLWRWKFCARGTVTYCLWRHSLTGRTSTCATKGIPLHLTSGGRFPVSLLGRWNSGMLS